MEVMVAEGIDRQPLDAISKRIAEMKFNCVRLTRVLFMVTDSTLGSVTFRQPLQNHGLVDTIKGVEVNNPALVDLPVIQVFQEVVTKLGDDNVMVILDNHVGLSYAGDLSFLSQKPLDLTFKGKLVYELHSYSWYRGSPNEACGKYVQDVMRSGGFLLDQGWPLFISEFGADESGTIANDNNFLNCFYGLAAERDLDWALWALQGS
ncbi:hypothetical protein AAC387_Pa02g3632 [Persea americana]